MPKTPRRMEILRLKALMKKKTLVSLALFSILIFYTQTAFAQSISSTASGQTKTASNEAELSLDATQSAALMLAPSNAQISGNKRIKVLQQYLNSFDSELAPYAEDFVKSADTYRIDWRLLVAISGVESTFAHARPANCNNAWGFGIYGDQVKCFASYTVAIDTISKAIRQDYIDRWGAQDVYGIGKNYAASKTWSSRVVYFMAKIDDLAAKNSTDDLSLSL